MGRVWFGRPPQVTERSVKRKKKNNNNNNNNNKDNNDLQQGPTAGRNSGQERAEAELQFGV